MYPPGFRIGTKKVPNPWPTQVIGQLPLPPTEYHRHLYGYTAAKTVVYDDINAYVWFGVAPLDVPVRVNLGETIGSTIVDADISFSYLFVSPIDVGVKHSLAAETLSDKPFRTFWVVGRSDEEGIISYRGETSVGRMARTPAPEVIKVGPFTPKQIIEELLTSWKDAGYDWLRWRTIPEIGLLTTDGLFVPTLDAIDVRQSNDPGQEPKSMLRVLQEFLEPFPGFFMHVDPEGYLEIANTYAIPIAQGSHKFGAAYPETATLTTIDSSKIAVEFTIEIWSGFTPTESFFTPYAVIASFDTQSIELEVGETRNLVLTKDVFIILGGNTTFTIDLDLTYDGTSLTATINSFSPTTNGTLYFKPGMRFTVRDSVLKVIDANNDLTPMEQSNTITDEVWNVCRVTSKGKSFNSQTDIMEPAAGLYRSYFICWGNKVCIRANHDTVFGTSGRFDLGETECKPIDNPSGNDGVFPKVWKPQPNYILGSTAITVTAQVLQWGDYCGDLAAPGYNGSVTITGTVYTDKGQWQEVGVARIANADTAILVRPVYGEDGTFQGFRVKVDPRTNLALARGIGVRLNGDGIAFTENTDTITAEFGEQSGDPNIEASIAVYGRRVKTIDLGPFPVSYDTAMKIAQAFVEHYSQPKTEYTIEVMPPYSALGPYDVGKRVSYEGKICYVSGWRYTEGHTANRSNSRLTVTLREIKLLNEANTTTDAYGEAIYRVSPYGG